jgi:hypothetical protein
MAYETICGPSSPAHEAKNNDWFSLSREAAFSEEDR